MNHLKVQVVWLMVVMMCLVLLWCPFFVHVHDSEKKVILISNFTRSPVLFPLQLPACFCLLSLSSPNKRRRCSI